MTDAVKKHEIVNASPQAIAMIAIDAIQLPRDKDEPNAKYPFKSLQIGESFVIPLDEIKLGDLSSLRSSASINNKRLGRKFKVIIHDEYKCVEVARIG